MSKMHQFSPNALDRDIEGFISGELIEFLELVVAAYKKDADIQLSFVDTPQMFAKTNEKVLQISLGYIQRVAIFLQLSHTAHQTLPNREKIIAINIENAFDAHFFYRPENADFNFQAVPDLAVIFMNNIDEEAQQEGLATFFSRFESRRGGYFDADGSYAGMLNFAPESKMSETIKLSLKICMSFVVLHEIGHIKRRHKQFDATVSSEQPAEADASDRQRSNLRKVCELDADAYALSELIEILGGPEELGKEGLFNILVCVFLTLSMFDLNRKSIAEFQTAYATHPASDVRAFSAVFMVSQSLNLQNKKSGKMILDLFPQAVEFVTRSYQYLAIPMGGFLILGNRYLTMDRQTSNDIFVMAVINDELERLSSSYQKLWSMHSETWIDPAWNFCPIWTTFEKLRADSQKHLENMISSSDEIGPTAAEIYATNLETVSKELNIMSGDQLIIAQNLELESPHVSKEIEGKVQKPVYARSPELEDEYQRIMHVQLSLLLHLADAKLSGPIEDGI